MELRLVVSAAWVGAAAAREVSGAGDEVGDDFFVLGRERECDG